MKSQNKSNASSFRTRACKCKSKKNAHKQKCLLTKAESSGLWPSACGKLQKKQKKVLLKSDRKIKPYGSSAFRPRNLIYTLMARYWNLLQCQQSKTINKLARILNLWSKKASTF